jgi:uncharacterized membrane protein
MVLMALDHVRDFFHAGSMSLDPLDPQTTTIPLYFTRWITHFCAPVFVFLSGISAYISSRRKTPSEFSVFLIKRGLFLILVEVTVITFGWTFNPFFNLMVLQVIWAIGASMVLLGLLSRLPMNFILFLSIAIIAGHNLLDPIEARMNGNTGFLIDALHHGGFRFYPVMKSHGLLIVYPLIPWLGIMLAGFWTGRFFTNGFNASARRKFLYAGIGISLGFLVLRYLNVYGDPGKWKQWPDAVQTLMSFLDTCKYPPSLLYSMMTIGPALIFLALCSDHAGKLKSILSVYGNVPFFYYVLHIYLIHILCVGLFFVSGYGAEDIRAGMFFFKPDQMGFGLPGVYMVFALVLLILYFPCKWFAGYRSRHNFRILKYM